MNPPSASEALSEVAQRLAELLGEPMGEVRLRREPRSAGPDAEVEVAGLRFLVEWKGTATAATLAHGADRLRRYATESGSAIPLLAVPFMGPAGRRQCEAAGVSWLDLSGNARIRAQGVRVLVEGKPNLYKRRGRPSSPFAPKSARIARWLLMHPHEAVSQRDLARATDMGEGFTSRIVRRLEQDQLVTRQPDGAVRVAEPDLLLDAWAEAYDFSKHRILRGHVAARSGEALARQAAEVLRSDGVAYAATGLAAAWLYDHFAGFRIATVYLREPPSSGLLTALGFREDERGANAWLVVPRDEGVFHGAAEREGVRCVHPVQVYLDLLAHPERAPEAAAHLRATRLKWGTDA